MYDLVKMLTLQIVCTQTDRLLTDNCEGLSHTPNGVTRIYKIAR